LVQCANPFHSNPAFPESVPWAVGGDLEVCKISVFHLAREVRFCAGFATLRPFKVHIIAIITANVIFKPLIEFLLNTKALIIVNTMKMVMKPIITLTMRA